MLLVAGVSLAVFEGSHTRRSAAGIAMCALGTVCNGLMMSASGRMMSEKVDPLRLTFYMSPVACFVLAPFYWRLEAGEFAAWSAAHGGGSYLVLLLLTCANALAYNVVHYLVIRSTSSVTATVLGEMKIVTILVLSAILLGESSIWTLQMLVGCTVAILGFCMYRCVCDCV